MAANEKGAKLGVIRWDAWVGPLDTSGTNSPYVGLQVEATLGPNQYHNRLPFYAQELSANSVQVRATSQAVMDAELAYANKAGIDFWAFVYYPPGSAQDIGRNLYKSSTVKGDVKFAHIIGINGTGIFPELVSDFARADYQRVLGNRPLLFIMTDGNDAGYTHANLDELRAASINAGLANPYVVVVASAAKASEHANFMGAEAISAYATFGSGGQSYSSLASNEQSAWNSYASTNKKVVPWITTGWDPRPRITTPVTWISYSSNAWAQQATAQQIREQVRAGTDWVAAHPVAAEAAVALMYAWNEFDEGGWVCPTLYDGTARVDAISDVMRFSASSSWDESQTPRQAFDGSLATNWQAGNGTSFAGQWLEQDFGVESTFSQAYLSEFGDRTGYFRIQYRTGDYWQDAYSGYGIGASKTVTFPQVRGRRARVLFDSGTSTPVIYEFQVNNAPATPNPNLAANKSYAASSTWAGGTQERWFAFDGSLGTNWQAANGSSFGNQWLEVQFGDLTTFNSVYISEYGNRTGSFRIEYWADGWKTAYSGSGIGSNATINFPPVTGTGARIRFVSGSNTPIIYEFGVYFN